MHLEFTEEVLRLQLRVQRAYKAGDDSHGLSAELYDAIVALRKVETGRLTRERTTEVVDMCLELWAAWARKPGAACFLPPPYPSTVVRKQLRYLVTKLQGRAGFSGGNNRVLKGPSGVGKTTMLRLFCILHAMRYWEDVVVYWSYGNGYTEANIRAASHGPVMSATLLTALNHVVAWAHGPQERDRKLGQPPSEALATTTNRAPEALSGRHGGQRYGIYCDDIHYLYRYHNSAIDAVRALVTLGKSNACLVVLSGSSSQLYNMAFPAPVGEWSHLPSLDSRAYSISVMDPLRTARAVQDYLQVRWGMDLQPGQAAAVLRTTGGVCRNVSAWYCSGADADNSWDSGPVQSATHLLCSLSPLHDAFVKFMHIMSAWQAREDDKGTTMSTGATEATRVDSPEATEEEKDIACVSFDALAEVGGLTRQELLDLEDAGVILRRARGYEYLAPCIGDMARKYIGSHVRQAQMFALSYLANGWPGGIPGTDCEPLVVLELISSRRPLRITTEQGVSMIGAERLGDGKLSDILYRPIVVTKATCIHCFIVASRGGGKLSIDVYQITLGETDTIGMGSLADERASELDSHHTIAGIVACLETRWRNFQQVLANAFHLKTKDIHLQSAHLVTNKTIEACALDKCKSKLVHTGRKRRWRNVLVPLNTDMCGDDFIAGIGEDVGTLLVGPAAYRAAWDRVLAT